MKKIAIFGVIPLIIATLAYGVAVYDQSNWSAGGRMFQPAPTGHVPGKDNGRGRGLHHQGEDCGKCHTMGGRAEMHLWTIAGTLYADRSGRTPLAGQEIIVEDIDGNVISLTTNAAGNFWTTAAIASNPYAVNAHGSLIEPLYTLDPEGNLLTPADPANPQTWQYKTWVKNGSSVRPMLTIAPVAGSSGMNMSCSMHHGNMGSRGALWSSPAPTIPSYPEENLSYRKHIYPILRSKCAPCHIPGPTMTRLVTKSDLDQPTTSIDYSNSLDLVTYEGSVVSGATKLGVLHAVNTAIPEESILLQKTLRGGTHAGGAFWHQRSKDYLALKQWIAEGALKN
jgi:hypothetical protein